METSTNADQNTELKKVHQLLAKNIDDLKYLVLCNMHLEEKTRAMSGAPRLEVNRISDFEQESAESLEEWVNREFAPKAEKKERAPFKYNEHAETLEEWVAKSQKIQPKSVKPSQSVLDRIEQWLMNEAKKDLFAQLDTINNGPEGLSSEYVRELGMNLISLADKLDSLKFEINISGKSTK